MKGRFLGATAPQLHHKARRGGWLRQDYSNSEEAGIDNDYDDSARNAMIKDDESTIIGASENIVTAS